ncbi:MAG TPA: DUF5682 family protein [Ktedonobacterales bacterium]|nr:DUF5682 family protein [Ktedonobacterales bacterium]
MGVTLFGVRHHGPGCARALGLALEALAPDIILVEGPPDAHDVLPLVAREGMTPPVALLVYIPETPARAVYYPLARFSPEWRALTFAHAHDIPARFIDLPQAVQLASEPAPPEGEAAEAPPPEGAQADEPAQAAGATAPASPPSASPAPEILTAPDPRDDPLALLAEAAGYDDHELWWERQIEQRRDITGFFEGILEAMSALRDGAPPRDEREAQREAHMRQAIRAALREGYQRVAVVTGAWHSPALRDLDATSGETSKAADAALLKGLPRAKVQATWVPWTSSRLAYRGGYGAGVTSPGWYEHLWESPDGAPARWLTRAAHTLRAEGLDVSSASVIEAVRLAGTLAALRDLPMPGLAEMREATLTVLCNGDAARLALVRDKLEIGARMGAVPDDTPTVPLARDLAAWQRRLRLKPTAEIQTLDLDVREESHLAKSHLLHRLALLGIPWGKPQKTYQRASGSFHELWQLQWQVEYVVTLIEASVWGNTVERATTAKVIADANAAPDLPMLSELLNSATLAGLSEGVATVLDRVRARAAATSDARHLLDALPPLVQIARYGDARGLRNSSVSDVRKDEVRSAHDEIFERALIALPNACLALDDDAAAGMVESIGHAHESVTLLDDPDQRGAWMATLRGLIAREAVHGLVRGRCCRLLLELRALDEGELRRLARLALSPAVAATEAAAWVEGVVAGPATTLLSQDGLWQALDAWLVELAPDGFVALLPLLRRAFSGFQAPERRAMGRKVRELGPGGAARDMDAAHGDAVPVDEARAALTLPVLAQILGGGPA